MNELELLLCWRIDKRFMMNIIQDQAYEFIY